MEAAKKWKVRGVLLVPPGHSFAFYLSIGSHCLYQKPYLDFSQLIEVMFHLFNVGRFILHQSH